jgi:hypothetical protein
VLRQLLSKDAAPRVISEADDASLPALDALGSVYSTQATEEILARLEALGYH